MNFAPVNVGHPEEGSSQMGVWKEAKSEGFLAWKETIYYHKLLILALNFLSGIINLEEEKKNTVS